MPIFIEAVFADVVGKFLGQIGLEHSTAIHAAAATK
jgi:hypothetical protein